MINGFLSFRLKLSNVPVLAVPIEYRYDEEERESDRDQSSERNQCGHFSIQHQKQHRRGGRLWLTHFEG